MIPLLLMQPAPPAYQAPAAGAPRLLDRVREAVRLRHYSLRTERAYVGWIKRFILFHGKRHPSELGAGEVTAFLSHLAVEGHVAASTRQQALATLLFPYRDVLEVDLPWMSEIVRPRRPPKVPTVLSRGEVERLLAAMEGTHAVMARLLYGTGMRLMECMRLRVNDVDFDRGEIVVCDGKGGKDRVTMLPRWMEQALREQVERGGVWLPDALSRKYPRAAGSWGWFWVFPARRHFIADPSPAAIPSAQ